MTVAVKGEGVQLGHVVSPQNAVMGSILHDVEARHDPRTMTNLGRNSH